MSYNQNTSSINVKRVIAIWAFSEAALGGILHALKIPFTGLIIGSTSVFCISLIAQFGHKKSDILKALVQVILVKAMVSPFAPLNSYLALCIQGVLGYLFFTFIPFTKLAAILLGGTALALSALQKFLVMTILFGNTLWESVDSFALLIVKQVPFLNSTNNFSFSMLLIFIYSLLHAIAGIYISVRSLNIEHWLLSKIKTLGNVNTNLLNTELLAVKNKSGRKKKWWQRPSGIVLITISFVVMIISYISPNIGKSNWYDILIMLMRSVVITIVWFSLISPLLIKSFRKVIEKQRPHHAKEIESIASLFPNFKTVASYCWNNSFKATGINRIRTFLSNTFALLLITDFSKHE